MDYGLIIDVETSGLDPAKDKIIEVGVLLFAWKQGEQPYIVETYGGLQDPLLEISPEIEKLTGIKNNHLLGQNINWPLVNSIFNRSQIAIAHNASFDKSFLSRVPELAEAVNSLHWACSLRHIDWSSLGSRSMSLNHLAADHGFINPFAHRALFDCATTFRVISPYLDDLVTRSYERQYRLYAFQAHFDKKDLLKSQQFRWDSEKRVWYKDVIESQLAQEEEFLKSSIYNGSSAYKTEELPQL